MTTNRSATSEVAEVRGTDREAVDTSLRTVLTNASQPGVDGPVTADGSLDIPSNGTSISVVQLKFVQRLSWISNLPLSLVQATMLSMISLEERQSSMDFLHWLRL